MKCFRHPEADALGYCRQCGKALCEACRRDLRGVYYCEDCLVATVEAGTTAPGGHSPGLALGLGFIPGVGAIYNGEYVKALVHFFVFVGLVQLNASGHMQPLSGLLLAGFILYMPFEAYNTAKRIAAGQAPARPGWEALGWGNGGRATPIGPLILIVLGALFLLNTLDIFHWSLRLGRLWPLILIAVGAWMLWKRTAGAPR